MDEFRERAVRTGLFEHLDDLLLASDDDTLGWNQTESFEFNGEAFSIRQARGRGIGKPAQKSSDCGRPLAPSLRRGGCCLEHIDDTIKWLGPRGCISWPPCLQHHEE